MRNKKALPVGPSWQRGNVFHEIRWPVLWVPAVRGKHFFRKIRWPVRWVPAVRGKRFFREIRWPVRWVPAVRGETFLVKYGGPSGGSLLSGGGILIFRIIRRHFLAAAVDPAVSLSMYSTLPMEVVP